MKQTVRNSSRSDVGMRIRRERNLWNMTQDDLSQELGISTNYLGQIERGTRDISRKMEDRLCEMFHLTHDEFRRQQDGKIWSAPENEAVFQNMSEEDLLRLLRSCSPLELQFCGHLIRCTMSFLRDLRTRKPLISGLNAEEELLENAKWDDLLQPPAEPVQDGLLSLLASER